MVINNIKKYTRIKTDEIVCIGLNYNDVQLFSYDIKNGYYKLDLDDRGIYNKQQADIISVTSVFKEEHTIVTEIKIEGNHLYIKI